MELFLYLKTSSSEIIKLERKSKKYSVHSVVIGSKKNKYGCTYLIFFKMKKIKNNSYLYSVYAEKEK